MEVGNTSKQLNGFILFSIVLKAILFLINFTTYCLLIIGLFWKVKTGNSNYINSDYRLITTHWFDTHDLKKKILSCLFLYHLVNSQAESDIEYIAILSTEALNDCYIVWTLEALPWLELTVRSLSSTVSALQVRCSNGKNRDYVQSKLTELCINPSFSKSTYNYSGAWYFFVFMRKSDFQKVITFVYSYFWTAQLVQNIVTSSASINFVQHCNWRECHFR